MFLVDVLSASITIGTFSRATSRLLHFEHCKNVSSEESNCLLGGVVVQMVLARWLPELSALAEEICREVEHVRYNHRLLLFLKNQTQKLLEVANSQQVPPQDFGWQVKFLLMPWLTSCKRMIKRHSNPLNLDKMYMVDEVKELIENCCQCLRETLRWSGKDIDDAVPDGDVAEDRNCLERHLGFVVGDADCGPGGASMQEWCCLKRELDNGLESLEIISEKEIEWESRKEIGSGGSAAVYVGRWKGVKMAVKKVENDEDDERKFEHLSQFHAEALLNASIRGHPNVVQVFAMSKSGVLIMELADEDLWTWCNRASVVPWSFKIKVMLQAAAGLCHLHQHNLIHRDVKSKNFVIFHGASGMCPVVKLCDMGVAVRQRVGWVAETTKRPQPGTKRYFAPEVDDGKPHSYESDVYSFGLVMCEIAAQRALYGSITDCAVMAKKQAGEPPYIPSDCPESLMKLIYLCLSFCPGDRPCMRDVEEDLRMLLQCQKGG